MVCSSLFNALEEPAHRLEERLADVQEQVDNLVKKTESSGCLLSGSGSSIFVLTPSRRTRTMAATLRKKLGLRCEPVKSLPRWGLYGMLEGEESSPC